jgi:hypothetical protein
MENGVTTDEKGHERWSWRLFESCYGISATVLRSTDTLEFAVAIFYIPDKFLNNAEDLAAVSTAPCQRKI